MCDCYEHPCEVCGRGMPMHIEDFKYPREAFRVWCGDHYRQAPKGAVVFYSKRAWRPYHMAILGPGAGDGNEPNWGFDADQYVVE